MKKAVFALLMAATPAAAFEEMQLAECQNTWLAIADMVADLSSGIDPDLDGDLDEMRSVQHVLSDDGWCRLVADSKGLEGARFVTMDWQAEDVSRFIADGSPPLALRARVKGVFDDAGLWPPYDLDFTLRQVPGAGLLLIEDLSFSVDDGKWASLTGVVNGAYFDTKSSTLSAMGGLAVEQVVAQFAISPELLAIQATSDINFGDEFQNAVTDMVDGLDDTQLPANSRAALMALLNDLPDAEGSLDLRMVSDRGLGWIQLVMAQTFNPDATQAEILGFAMSGVTVTASWTPVE